MGRGKFKAVDEAYFDGDILVTDPCYLRHGGVHEMGRAVGWNPDETEKFVRDRGGLYSTTYYGDWGCTIYRTEGEVVGRARQEQEQVPRLGYAYAATFRQCSSKTVRYH